MTSIEHAQQLRQHFAADPERARAWVRSLPAKQQEQLRYTWPLWARPEQLPPAGDWTQWIINAGRGWGKTRTGAEMVRAWREQGVRQALLIGDNAADVRDTMVEGPSGVLAVCPPWDQPRYIASKRQVYWRARRGLPAMRLLCLSAEDPEQIRGPNAEAAWWDEPAKCRRLEAALANLLMAVRIERPGGLPPQVVYTTTPRRTPAYAALLKASGAVVTQGRTLDNAGNLSPAAVAQMMRLYAGTRLGRQELEGELLADVDGALWTSAMIDNNRASRHGRYDGPPEADARPWYIWDTQKNLYRPVPEFVEVVVGVDPSAADGGTGAECGIIAIARGDDGHLYVLEDATVSGSPATWAAATIACYHRWRANRVVAEINQGGAMVTHTLEAAGAGVAVEGVHSKDSKRLRAEPLSTRYERGEVHHLGAFPALEEQMCTWVHGERSPDRLDALVHGGAALAAPQVAFA